MGYFLYDLGFFALYGTVVKLFYVLVSKYFTMCTILVVHFVVFFKFMSFYVLVFVSSVVLSKFAHTKL